MHSPSSSFPLFATSGLCFSLLFMACSSDPNDTDSQNQAGDSNGGGDEPTDPSTWDPQDCSPLTQEDVNGGVTLPGNQCYTVAKSLTVNQGVLTIEAGATFFFDHDTALIITREGRLQTQGTRESEVVFRGREAERGYWAGLLFNNTGEGQNHLEGTAILHAGGKRHHGGDYSRGGIFLQGRSTRISVNASRFEQNAFAALSAENDESELSIAGSRIAHNDLPFVIRANHFAGLASDLEFEDNEQELIYISQKGRNLVTRDGTWPGYTYRSEAPIEIRAAIIVEPGASFHMAQGTAVKITGDNASLNSQGTAERPVIWTKNSETDTRGSWMGLLFSQTSSAANQLKHTIIEYAGERAHSGSPVDRGGLVIHGDITKLTVEDSIFRHNQFAGAHLRADEAQVSISSSLFANNEFPLYSPANHIAQLSDLRFQDNDREAIGIGSSTLSNASGTRTTLTRAGSWARHAVPYEVFTSLRLQAELTLAPGTELHMHARTLIDVTRTGALSARGESTAPILFQGTDKTLAGHWRGFGFTDSLSSHNQLSHVQIHNAGESAWTGNSNSRAALYLTQSARVQIDALSFAHLPAEALHISVSATQATLISCTEMNWAELRVFWANNHPHSACQAP